MLEIYDRGEREMAAYSTTVRCEVCQRTTHLVSVDRGCDDRYEAGDLTACCYSEDFVVLRYDDDDDYNELEEWRWDPAYHSDQVVAIGYGYRIAQDGPVFCLFWLILFVIGLTNNVAIAPVGLRKRVGTDAVLPLSFGFGAGHAFGPFVKPESLPLGLRSSDFFVLQGRESVDTRVSRSDDK